MPQLFAYQQQNAGRKKHNWQKAVMMLSVTMHQGVCPHCKCQEDHKPLKNNTFYNINTKK